MGQIADAHHAEQFQVAHIHIDVVGDVGGQALDFDFAEHLVQDASGSLDSHRNAHQLDTDADLESFVHGDPLEVDVDQLVLDRLPLPVHDHGFHRRLVPQVDVENRVMPGLGEQDF